MDVGPVPSDPRIISLFHALTRRLHRRVLALPPGPAAVANHEAIAAGVGRSGAASGTIRAG